MLQTLYVPLHHLNLGISGHVYGGLVLFAFRSIPGLETFLRGPPLDQDTKTIVVTYFGQHVTSAAAHFGCEYR